MLKIQSCVFVWLACYCFWHSRHRRIACILLFCPIVKFVIVTCPKRNLTRLIFAKWLVVGVSTTNLFWHSKSGGCTSHKFESCSNWMAMIQVMCPISDFHASWNLSNVCGTHLSRYLAHTDFRCNFLHWKSSPKYCLHCAYWDVKNGMKISNGKFYIQNLCKKNPFCCW